MSLNNGWMNGKNLWTTAAFFTQSSDTNLQSWREISVHYSTETGTEISPRCPTATPHRSGGFPDKPENDKKRQTLIILNKQFTNGIC